MSVVVAVNKQMTHYSVNKTNCDRGNVIYLFTSYGPNIDTNLLGIPSTSSPDNGTLSKSMCFKGKPSTVSFNFIGTPSTPSGAPSKSSLLLAKLPFGGNRDLRG